MQRFFGDKAAKKWWGPRESVSSRRGRKPSFQERETRAEEREKSRRMRIGFLFVSLLAYVGTKLLKTQKKKKPQKNPSKPKSHKCETEATQKNPNIEGGKIRTMKGNRGKLSSVAPSASPMILGRRDSDASLCSSRPSSAGGNHPFPLLTDRSSQASALRSINAYLSSVSAPFSLKPPLPSARDISLCLRLLLSRLHLQPPSTNSSSNQLVDNEDILSILKLLKCPIKINRSALKAPGTPHSWPALLSLLHWLLNLARYADHRLSSPSPLFSSRGPNDLLTFTTQAYSLFITGEDDAEQELVHDYAREMEAVAAAEADYIAKMEKEAAELEEKVTTLRTGPSRKEEMERESAVLVEDAMKFESVVGSFKEQIGGMERKLGDLEKELDAKEMESRRIAEENEGLRRRIQEQGLNARDVERMKRETHAADRDIAELESSRIALEEKAWEMDAEIERKWKDVEALAEQGNHAMRKLKLGDDLQYVLNPEGSTPAEVVGVDYKNTLKPSLAAMSEEIKKAPVSKLEKLMALRQQSRENDAMLDEKRGFLAAIQAKVNEGEARISSIKNEIEDSTSKCAIESKKLKEDFTRKEEQTSIVEKEAAEYLEKCEVKLRDAKREVDEETQTCAHELLALIDDVSEYKEFMESLTSKMRSDVLEHVKFVRDLKASAVSSKLASIDFNRNLKRARGPSGAV